MFFNLKIMFKVNRIGGGMIGGEKQEIQKWFIQYYTTMNRYVKLCIAFIQG